MDKHQLAVRRAARDFQSRSKRRARLIAEAAQEMNKMYEVQRKAMDAGVSLDELFAEVAAMEAEELEYEQAAERLFKE